MRRFMMSALLAGSLGIVVPGPTSAQFLEVGADAPDIEFQGATRYGVLDGPSKLSEYRGEVIVLAFFFRARTSG
ncbi:MAG: hypothetical protein RQ745_05200 [Longimicrobiales bacterium]|nr:hypothetical protein [Longimicrobiales bacterium]